MPRGRRLRSKVREVKALRKAELKAEREERKKETLPEKIERFAGELVKNPSSSVDAAIYAGLAYLGFDKTKSWEGALLGPVSLKLASSPSEAAAIAGVAGLVSLGVMSVIPGLPEAVGDAVSETESAVRDAWTSITRGLVEHDEVKQRVSLGEMSREEYKQWLMKAGVPFEIADRIARTFIAQPPKEIPPSKPVPVV